MKVAILKQFDNRKVGSILDLHESIAKALIAKGLVEATEAEAIEDNEEVLALKADLEAKVTELGLVKAEKADLEAKVTELEKQLQSLPTDDLLGEPKETKSDKPKEAAKDGKK